MSVPEETLIIYIIGIGSHGKRNNISLLPHLQIAYVRYCQCEGGRLVEHQDVIPARVDSSIGKVLLTRMAHALTFYQSSPLDQYIMFCD